MTVYNLLTEFGQRDSMVRVNGLGSPPVGDANHFNPSEAKAATAVPLVSRRCIGERPVTRSISTPTATVARSPPRIWDAAGRAPRDLRRACRYRQFSSRIERQKRDEVRAKKREALEKELEAANKQTEGGNEEAA